MTGVFHFYCDPTDAVDFPDSFVLFGVCPADCSKFNKNVTIAEILEEYNKIHNRFTEILENLDIKVYDKLYIEAKNMPIITKHLLDMGWKNHYIPFGP